MTLTGPDRYPSTQPCAVCGAMTTSSFSDLCSTHKAYVSCHTRGEYDDLEERTRSRRNHWLCNDCYMARSCDVCGRESDDIRAGIETRMCPDCYRPNEEVA